MTAQERNEAIMVEKRSNNEHEVIFSNMLMIDEAICLSVSLCFFDCNRGERICCNEVELQLLMVLYSYLVWISGVDVSAAYGQAFLIW